MIWLLANWRIVLFGAVVLALGVQTGRISLLKAEHAEYVAKINQEVAENKAKAALETARLNANATEALDDLQARYSILNARYNGLRQSGSSKPVPSLAESTGVLSSCHGEPGKPNPAVGQMERLERGVEEILKFGDVEISKLVESHQLQQNNAK